MFKPINSWKQDKFVISAYSTWWGRNNVEKYMKNLKEANIGLVISCDEPYLEREYELYDYLEKIDLPFLAAPKTVFTEKRIEDEAVFAEFVENLKNNKSFYGFYVWDEPREKSFADILYNQMLMEKYAPGKATYTCLLPSYGPFYWDEDEEDRESYIKYITDFCNEARPAIISNDYYPYRDENTSLSVDNIYKDMGYLRKVSIEKDIPYWHVFQAVCDCTNHHHGFLTPERIAVQINIALAHGAKGVSYFVCSDIIVHDNGEKSDEHAAYAILNASAQKTGDELFGMQSLAVYHGGQAAEMSDKYYADCIDSSHILKGIPEHSLVGLFANGNGENVLAVTNKDYKNPLKDTIELRGNYNVSVFNDEGYNTLAENTEKFTVEMEEGGIRLYKLEVVHA